MYGVYRLRLFKVPSLLHSHVQAASVIASRSIEIVAIPAFPRILQVSTT